MEQSMDMEGTEVSFSGVVESVKVKVFRSGDSDSTDSGNSTKGAPNESYTSAADITLSPSPNEKSDLHFCRSSLKELRNLPTNKWNNGNAHKVLGAFRVKRYRIDPDYVLCPTGRGLLVSDRLKLHSDSWNQIQPKIDRLTDVFKGDTHLITDIYDDCADEETKVKCFQMALSRLERNIAAIQKESFLEYQFSKVEHCWHEYLLNHITENLEKQFLAGKILQEYCYEDYFHYLIRLLTKISDLDICLKKTISRADFGIPSSDKAQPVKPDFFLVKDLQEGLLAVVEVKTPRNQGRYASHRGHRVPSCKHPLPEDDKGAAANVNEEAMEEEDQENEDDKKKNEAYEQQESDIEESQKHLLPKYLGNLNSKEKHQLRCILPQLFGQMLATFCLPDRVIKTFDKTNTCRFGISVVGMKVRFVSMVLKDAKEDIVLPTAADLYQKKSVRPYLYVTRSLNLFCKQDVGIFLQTIYALCTL